MQKYPQWESGNGFLGGGGTGGGWCQRAGIGQVCSPSTCPHRRPHFPRARWFWPILHQAGHRPWTMHGRPWAWAGWPGATGAALGRCRAQRQAQVGLSLDCGLS